MAVSAKKPNSSVPTKPVATVRQRFKSLRNLPKFLRLVWQASPFLTLANAVLRLLRAALPLAILHNSQHLLDTVITITHAPLAGRSLHPVLALVAIGLGLAVLVNALGRVVSLVDGLLGDVFTNKMSLRLMEHAASLDLRQFEDSFFYDKLDRARKQNLARTTLMSQVLAQGQDMLGVAFLAVGLLVFNPLIVLLLLVAIAPAFIGESHFNSRSYSLVHSATPERRELDYLRNISSSVETAKEVKVFGLSSFLLARFGLLSQEFYTKNKAIAVRRASWGVVLDAVGILGYYAAYLYILKCAVDGRITVGQLLFLSGAFARTKSLLEDILSRFSALSDGALYLTDFFDFFALQPTISARAASSALPFPQPIQQGFEFENVGFQYPDTTRWAIRGVSFRLRAGEKLALVGENGSGKTTIVKLLARLYDPTEGRILLDGRDLRAYDAAEVRRYIGVIFQDFVRFQFTAGLNVAVGLIAEKENQPLIKWAAEQSLADTVVAKLPNGYDQMIGRMFADGVDLSGGEWQKIALGRAYMRDAALLILDEPTSALDARAEYEVFQRFADLTSHKTAIFISHRFSTVRMADRILVLDKGQLLEAGSHEVLLAKGGQYAELFNIQALGYK